MSAAAADTEPTASPSPSVTEDGYVPPEEPTLTAKIFEPICDGDVPYLRYAVVPTGTPNTTVTITWINPSGDDVVMPDLPLSGRVLWPGAVTDASGAPLDWPGWRLENGVWVEGDEFDWVRPSVKVKFKVNPELTAVAAYPPSSPNCKTNPDNPPGTTTPPPGETTTPTPGAETTPPGGFLPRTGSEIAPLAASAVGLVAAGVVTVLAVRRRRSEH